MEDPVVKDVRRGETVLHRTLQLILIVVISSGCSGSGCSSERSGPGPVESAVRDVPLAGVPILVGTDLGASLVYPGFSVHDELKFLVEQGGLSPLEALRGATVYSARSLAATDAVSTIAPGMQADLLLLARDPLENIGHTQSIHGVVLRGRYFDRAALDRLLTEAEAAARR